MNTLYLSFYPYIYVNMLVSYTKQNWGFDLGEFRGGKIWGNGLMTYADGSPSSEGYFQETKFRSLTFSLQVFVKVQMKEYARNMVTDNGWPSHVHIIHIYMYYVYMIYVYCIYIFFCDMGHRYPLYNQLIPINNNEMGFLALWLKMAHIIKNTSEWTRIISNLSLSYFFIYIQGDTKYPPLH